MNAPAKPILPASPMDMGDIVAGAWTIYRRAPLRWLALTLVSIIVMTPLEFLAARQVDLSKPLTNEEMVNALPWTAPVALGFVLVNLFSYTLIVLAAAEMLRGGSINVARTYERGLALYPAALVAGIVFILMVLAVASLFLAPFGLYFGILLALMLQVIAIEEAGPGRAIGRSRAIIRGHWFRVFGILLAILLLSFLPQLVIGALIGGFQAPLLTAFGAALATAVALPFIGIALTLLYADLRVRKGERPLSPPATPITTEAT